MQDKFYAAAMLGQIARLLQVIGENPFKTRAYERAARALENLDADFDALVKSRRLTEIDGVGNALAAIIDEIYHSGESALLRQMRDELPPGAVELSAIPGLSMKKIAALHDKLVSKAFPTKDGMSGRAGARRQRVGEKAEAKILAAIEQLEKRPDRTLLNHALAEAERLLQYMRACPAVRQADIAGSLRRRKETVHRIVIVAAPSNRSRLLISFCASRHLPNLAK